MQLTSTARLLLLIGALSGFFAVALGAFGAHALKSRLEADMLTVFETGARYQIYNSLALLAVGMLLLLLPNASKSLSTAGWLLGVGMAIFSGSLYLLSLSGIKAWGAVTPLGGLCLLAGWLTLAWAIWKA